MQNLLLLRQKSHRAVDNKTEPDTAPHVLAAHHLHHAIRIMGFLLVQSQAAQPDSGQGSSLHKNYRCQKGHHTGYLHCYPYFRPRLKTECPCPSLCHYGRLIGRLYPMEKSLVLFPLRWFLTKLVAN